jgi:hypothetical protein
MVAKSDNQPEVRSLRVSQAINKRLNERNLSRAAFIRLFQKQYPNIGARNHLYKIMNGQVFAGEDGTLPRMCKLLDLDLDEITKLLHKDKIDDKQWAHAIPRADKMTLELATIMEGLKPGDREELLNIAKMKAGMR